MTTMMVMMLTMVWRGGGGGAGNAMRCYSVSHGIVSVWAQLFSYLLKIVYCGQRFSNRKPGKIKIFALLSETVLKRKVIIVIELETCDAKKTNFILCN